MTDIHEFPVPLSASLGAFARGQDAAADDVLLREGLDLLAFYTAIGDKGVRMAIKDLVERIAVASRAGQR